MFDKKGLLLVVSGPSGAGKGTICKSLLEKTDDIKLSISATTREPRVGEIEGENYYFLSKDRFKKMILKNEFLEYAKIYDNFYGTPKSPVIDSLENGKDVLLEIEMQGAMQIKKVYPEAVFIFILPPSLDELKKRITGRGTETKEQIEKRFSCAYEEIKLIDGYDYFVINEDIDYAVKEIQNIMMCEKNRVVRFKESILNKFREEL